MKLTIQTFMSLDGVVQAPGGPDEDRDGGFEHGGWMVPYADEELERLVSDWIGSADAFVLGRKTYDIFAAAWPLVTDPNDSVAATLNGRPKHVASRTLEAVDWQGANLIRGDVATEVAKLRQMPGRELQVHGSGNLCQTLYSQGLVDRLRLLIYPVVLGTGKRLFEDGTPPAAFKLTSSRTTGNGVLICDYEAAGAPSYGAYEVEDHVETARNARQA